MNNLLKAIELAQRPGSCQYLNDDNTPCCVMAQLYVLEGGDPLDMADWGNKRIHVIMSQRDEVCVLDKYSRNLLRLIQKQWDDSDPKHEKYTRKRMKRIANKYTT